MTEDETTAAKQASAAVDVGLGLVFAACASVALLWLIPTQVSGEASGTDLSPAFIPRLSAGLILGLSLAMVAERLLRARPQGGLASGLRLVIETTGLAIGAVAVMFGILKLGFIATAIGMILAGGVLSRHRSRWGLLILAVLFPLVVEYGAWHIFFVDLP